MLCLRFPESGVPTILIKEGRQRLPLFTGISWNSRRALTTSSWFFLSHHPLGVLVG